MVNNSLIYDAIQKEVGNPFEGIGASIQDINNNIGYYFDIIQEHSLSVQNQITDNWMESNVVIGDHIAHQPIIITLRGLIGELVYVPPTTVMDFSYNAANSLTSKYNIKTDKLLAIPQLVPSVDNVTQLAKNAVQYVESSYKRYEKIVKNFVGIKEAKLLQVYKNLVSFSNSNTSLIVETPYQTFENMYIQSINFSQGNQLYTSDITVTLKQVYFTETLTTKADKEVLAKYTKLQREEVEDHGKMQGVETDSTILYDKFGRNINIQPKIRN